jgi:hypothetical protein
MKHLSPKRFGVMLLGLLPLIAFAHGISEEDNQRKDTLIKSGKLDKSWGPIKHDSISFVEGKKGKEWKVIFSNMGAPDQTKTNLFMFFTPPGNFIAANYTGQ